MNSLDMIELEEIKIIEDRSQKQKEAAIIQQLFENGSKIIRGFLPGIHFWLQNLNLR